MVQFMSRKRYALILIATFAFVFIFTFLVLSLPSYERNFFSLAIVPLVLTALSTGAVYSAIRKTIKDTHRTIKYTAIVFIFALIMFESIMALITIHSIASIALLVPIDLVLLSLPLYITFRSSRGIRDGDEYSNELSERLASLTGNSNHKVYIRNAAGPALGTATDGNDWSILIFSSAFSRLNDEEIEMLMLEKYYNKELGRSWNMLYAIFGAFVILTDLVLATYILGMNLPPADEAYIIPSQIVIFIAIFSLPFIIMRKSISSYRDIDRKILSVNGNRMALISLIEKENDYDPPGTMTKYQYNRFKERQRQNAERRIRNIE
ncbi:MAG: hypothetical protein RE471_07420 [Ferroplasma sp.]|uniref:hypothetical protein n=1 Tax=Ferroplasma sp. TaxID=2591003 RepID=UPI0028163AA1|nr:hypothetical protein [Ferroplasma sp.]WMT50800.1 MAG: hypothetical protein RE471_07420 [Ferroplasma sp.]